MIKIILMCGGSGTRLFPLSRKNFPKQFAPLFGDRTLFQKTLLRIQNLQNRLQSPSEILVITNQEHYFLALDQSQKVQVKVASFLLEDSPRDTTPALILSALSTIDHDLLLFLPSDHIINDLASFEASIQEALVLAKEDKIITFGIKPTSPHTGYGYIHAQGDEVLEFCEKPNLQKAEDFLSQGNYFWNSGMFCFKREVFLQECQTYIPQILNQAQKVFDKAQKEGHFIRFQDMQSIEKISIDYAIMEKTSKIKMIKGDFDWNDVGSFDSLAQEFTKDQNGNITPQTNPEYYQKESYGNFILSNKTTALIGVENLSIIDTKDALLIARKGKTQEIKEIVEQIQLKNPQIFENTPITHRPWGSYEVLEEGPNYKIKKIIVKPQKRLSLQKHFHRNEHWIIVSGSACIQIGEKELFLQSNQSTYIPMGTPHRLSNLGQLDLVMIEVQVGEYVGEDDIVRLEDDYYRA